MKTIVTYDTRTIDTSETVEHRRATSIYFLNRTNVPVKINDVPINPGETLQIFKNDVGEEINTSFNAQIPANYIDENDKTIIKKGQLFVVYEFKYLKDA